MLAHKQFGLPLPINIINPYRISLGALLEDGLTAPEGCLKFLREDYYKEWIAKAESWLEEHGVSGKIVLEEKEYPKYVFKCENGMEKIKNLRTSNFDMYYRKLTLGFILQRLQKRDRDPMLYQFIDLIKEQLGGKEYNDLLKEYSILCLDCKKR